MLDFAAIDFETANKYQSSVCSVGVVIVEGGQVTDSYYHLIRPIPNYYNIFTTQVHGLTYEDTADAPPFSRSMGRHCVQDTPPALGCPQQSFRRTVS